MDEETSTRCLEAFPRWLASLGEDAADLCTLMTAESIDQNAKELLAGGLNYLIKSLDLIPDGIEDLGLLDDVFVLKISCELALRDVPKVRETDIRGVLPRIAEGVDLIRSLLGEEDYLKLEAFTRRQARGAARGRSVREIVADDRVRVDFCQDVKDWSKGYQPPSFSGDPNALVKLRSFLSTKLQSL